MDQCVHIILQSSLPRLLQCKEPQFGFSKRNNLTFLEGGFCNCKKALQRFTDHEKSEMHREAMMKLTARSSIVDVGIQLSTQHDVDMKNHHAMFLKLLECVRYLAR